MAGKEHSIEIVDLDGTVAVTIDKDGVAIATAAGEDKLKVNSKIVDYRRAFSFNVDSATVAGHVHVVDDRYVIESIREKHKTAADAGGAINIGVSKGAVTPANSTAQHSTALNMAFTADTVVSPTITTQTTMDAGDSICVKNVANLTNLAGGNITIVLKRVV